MPLKFCGNLSFSFQETSSFIERYAAAAKVGFRAVECAFPNNNNQYTLQQIVEAKNNSGLQQVLINIHVGDASKGSLGTAAFPGQEVQFKKSLELTIEYAKALKCDRVHVMSGAVEKVTQQHHATYELNIKYAASLLKKHNICCLIEPINNWSVPHYYMNSYDKALELVRSTPNLHILLDIFHLQQLKGNLTRNIKELLPYVGHIQIAQVPDRHEPDTAGEINFPYILSLLEKQGYDQWIGLEYKPQENSITGLKWIKEYGYEL